MNLKEKITERIKENKKLFSHAPLGLFVELFLRLNDIEPKIKSIKKQGTPVDFQNLQELMAMIICPSRKGQKWRKPSLRRRTEAAKSILL